MKILLIQPPVRDFYQTSIRRQPIGLAYLAASLKAHGHQVEILDCQTGKRRSLPIPAEFSYLRDFYPVNDRSPFKLYSGFYHFGMGWDEIRQRVQASQADLFGISSSFTPYHGEALEIARIIKEWNPKKWVVMGGAHVSCDPEGVLRSGCVDFVVMGEGEVRFPLLVEKIESSHKGDIGEIDGIGYRANGEARIHPLQNFLQNLDQVPFPARDLLDLDQYRIGKRRSTMLITSRGCPHRCAYCSARLVMGNAFRARSPVSIVKEMTECRDRYGIEGFDIEDDNFTFDQERAKRLLTLIIETFGEGTLDLSAMNGISHTSLDDELLRLMKKAGFRTLNLSFVSADRMTKERMNRPKAAIGFDQILEGAEREGLSVIAYAILGMPDQTVKEMVDTLIYLMGKRVLIGPSIYYPTPETPLFERCRSEGRLPDHVSQWRASAFPIETEAFSRFDLVTLFRLARLINFVKGRMDRGELEEGMNWKELLQIVEKKVTAANEDSLPWKDVVAFLSDKGPSSASMKEIHGKESIIGENGSEKVLSCFLEKAMEKPILKSRPWA